MKEKKYPVDRIIKLYGNLYNREHIPYYLLTPARKLVRKYANRLIPRMLAKEVLTKDRPSSEVVVSFTSFPARIESVYLVVKCMLRQTVIPKKVILWLSKEQFHSIPIPKSLLDLTGDVFEIRMVDADFRSHKKYHYAFKEFRNDLVVLIDDDLFYESTMIEELLEEHNKYPNAVICRYGSEIMYNEDGSLPPFNTWWRERKKPIVDKDFFLGTGGGSMFQPNLLIETTEDIDLAIKLTPFADDIWINAMVRLSGLKIVKIKCGLLLQITSQQDVALKHLNAGESLNDVQFKDVIQYFENHHGINPFSKQMN